MGVDYRVWIIPRERAFRPRVDQVASLANAMREGGWVPMPDASGQQSRVDELLAGADKAGRRLRRSHDFTEEPFTPGWVEFHSQNELVLHWDVRNTDTAGVQYPFNFDPYPDSQPPYFHVFLILGDSYFYRTGDNVLPFDEQYTTCACGEQLAHWIGWSEGAGSERIHRICPKCGKIFDPSEIACDLLDGWTRESQLLAGGLTFRFALMVDCHKSWPHEEEAGRRFHLRPEFVELWRTCIGVPFELVVTFD
jgi:hypothetical protein